MAYPFLIEIFDIYGKSYNFYIFSNEKYKSKIGSFFGFLSILAMLSISIFFILQLFNRSIIFVISNDDATMIPINNLTNTPIMLGLSDSKAEFINADKLYNWSANMLYYINKVGEDGLNNLTFSYVNIELEKCDPQKHFTNYEGYFSIYNFSYFYCFTPEKVNMTIFGKFGDSVNGWSMLEINILECDSSYQDCYNQSYINSQLFSSYASIIYISNVIDNSNTTQPNKIKLQSTVLSINSLLKKTYNYYLRQNIYQSDFGYVFQEFESTTFYTYDYYTEDVNFGAYYVGGNLGEISIRNSETISLYYRTFTKAQTVLANIGGIIKAIMILANIFVDFLTRRLDLNDIYNSIYLIKNEKKEFNFDFSKLKKNKNMNYISNLKHYYSIRQNRNFFKSNSNRSLVKASI